MSDGPTVSCIVPVRNDAAFIAAALESVFAQRGPGLDVIVVSDGSTDGSARIAQGFDGVRVLRQARAGVAAARNKGLRHTRGEYIAFLDADDLWLPGKLAAQLEALKRAPDAAYCITMVRHVATDPDGALPHGEAGEVKVGRLMQCLLARRGAFENVGEFNTETLTRADQDWFLRADALALKSVVLPEVFTIRRIHGNNHSLRNATQVRDDLLTIAKRNLDRKRQQGNEPRSVS